MLIVFSCGSFSSFISAEGIGAGFSDDEILCTRRFGGYFLQDDESAANGDTCQLGACSGGLAAFSYVGERSDDDHSVGRWRGRQTCTHTLLIFKKIVLKVFGSTHLKNL